MSEIRAMSLFLAAGVLWSGGVSADPAAAAQKTAVPAASSQSLEQAQVRLKSFVGQRRQQLMGQESAKRATRVQGLRASFASIRSGVSSRVALTPDCGSAFRIDAVTPDVLLPGDPVLVTGCGFGGKKGTLVFSEGNQQMVVTAWTGFLIEATVPEMTGFADPKTVTLKVATAEAGKSLSSKPLVLKPILELGVGLLPSWTSILQGCNKDLVWGIVGHTYSPVSTPGCSDEAGTDILKFSTTLKNNWTYHSLDFQKSCSGGSACGGENDATPVTGGLQLGQSTAPDLPVHWKRSVVYYAVLWTIGPAGTVGY
jgi:hypothetical protein